MKAQRLERAREHFHCQRCGNCCRELYGGAEFYASDKNLTRWQGKSAKTNRGRVYEIEDLIATGITADVWMNPETGDEFLNCPFLKKIRGKPEYKCLIYEIRPDCCRTFPFNNGEFREDMANICPEVRRLIKYKEAYHGEQRVDSATG